MVLAQKLAGRHAKSALEHGGKRRLAGVTQLAGHFAQRPAATDAVQRVRQAQLLTQAAKLMRNSR
jgi:hypothetical protein